MKDYAKNLLKKIDFLIKNKQTVLPLEEIKKALEYLPKSKLNTLFSLLNTKLSANLFKNLNEDLKNIFVKSLNKENLIKIASQMASDDLTDLLLIIPKKLRYIILQNIGKKTKTLKKLLSYPQNTAGSIMATEYIKIYEDIDVKQAIFSIQSQKNISDYHIFVINRVGQIIGIISFRMLVLANNNQKISEFMNKNIISVKDTDSYKTIIKIVKQYDIPIIPVVNENNVLIGKITFDDIMDIIDDKSISNIFRIVGLKEHKLENNPSISKSSIMRIPWLFFGLVGGIINAFIFKLFEGNIINSMILSFFVPVIMSMGGNIGIQSSTIVMSNIINKNNKFINFFYIVFKEISSSIITGFVCSLILFIVIFYWQGMKIATLVGGALFIIMNSGAVIGTLTPFLLKKLNINPILATGPFISIVNDITALFIYLSIISIIL